MAIDAKDILLRIRSELTGSGLNDVTESLSDLGVQATAAALRTERLRKNLEAVDKKKFRLRLKDDAVQEVRKSLDELDASLDAFQKRRFVPKDIREVVRTQQIVVEDLKAALEQDLKNLADYGNERARLIKKQAHNESIIQILEAKVADETINANQRRSLALRLRERANYVNKIKAIEARQAGPAFASLTAGLKTTTRDVDKIGRSIVRTATETNDWGRRIEGLSTVLTRISPIVRGVTILISAALTPAILAFVSAIGGAIAGLGVLATSFTAALLPSIALFQGFMSRLTAVTEVLAAKQKVLDAAQQATAQSAEIAAQNAERLRNARNTLRDATEQVVGSERNLAETIRQVRDQMRQANEAARQAAVDLTEANRDLARETTEAYQAIRDAAREAKEAVLSVAEAQLNVRQANLGLREAQLELKKFLASAGMGGEDIDDLFKKFEDVDFKPTEKLRKALIDNAKARGVEGEKALKLEDLILKVEQAKLREQQANLDLKQSQDDLNDKQREANRLRREGIKGVDAYRSAVARVADAQERLTEATREASRLNAQGVDGSPQVIAARANLRDSLQRERESTLDLAAARKEASAALRGGDDALKEFQRLLEGLSPAERDFALRIGAITDAFKKLVQEGTDPIFSSLSGAVQKIAPLGPALGALSKALGNIAADNLTKFVDLLTSPGVLIGLGQIALASTTLLRALTGPILRDAFQGFLNIAVGALPLLNEGLKAAEGFFRNFAESTRNFGETDTFKALSTSLKAVTGFLFQTVRLFKAFGTATASVSGEFIDFLADGAKGMADFLNSAEGQKDISRFLEETLPFAKEFLRFLKRVVVISAKLFQFFAPALADIVRGFNFLLDIVDNVLDFFNAFPTTLKRILGLAAGVALLSKFVTAFSTVIKGTRISVNLAIVALAGLGAAIKAVGDFLASGLGQGIKRGFNAVVGAIKRLVSGIINTFKDLLGIRSPSTVFMRFGRDIVRGLIRGIRGAAGIVFEGMASLVRSLVRGIRRGGEFIFNAGRFVVDRVVAGVVSVFQRLVRIGGNVITWIRRGVVAGARRVLEIGRSIVSGLVNGIQDAARGAFDAAKGLAEGILNTVKSVLGIRSPSREMEKLGKFTAQGFIKGLSTGQGAVEEFIKKNMGAAGMSSVAKLRFGQTWAFIGSQFGAKDFSNDLFNSANWAQLLDGTPFGGLRKIAVDLLGNIIPQFAKGGLVTGSTLAQIGEGAHNEVVLPLSDAVFSNLARSIVAAMSVSGTGPLSAAGVGGGRAIEQHFHIPPGPESSVPDARYVAAQLATELKRRGGGVI